MKRRLLRWAATYEARIAWVLLAVAVGIAVAVVTNLIATGDAKWATLLIAVDLFYTAVGALREAYGEELDEAEDDGWCSVCDLPTAPPDDRPPQPGVRTWCALEHGRFP
jgi:hypothetical protein